MLWAPFDPTNFKDPYPMYKTLQDSDPVHHAQTGEYIFTRYEDAKQILKDPSCVAGNRLNWVSKGIRYLQNKEEDFQAITEAMQSFLLFKNPPDHTYIRKFVNQCWSSREVEGLVLTNIRELLDQINPKEFDLVNDFGRNLPAMTISKILGLPDGDYRMLRTWATSLIKSLDLYISVKDLVQIHSAAKNFIEYFKSHSAKIKKSSNGLIAKMIEANKTADRSLTDEELVSIFIFLFVSGEETTVSLVSTGIYNLLNHPEQKELLVSQPELIDTTIDELLRYDSPVQLLGRISSQPLQLQNKEIPPGSTLTLVLGAANRDESIFKGASSLNITRSPNRHLAFGTGVHFCLGDWLARLQGKLAIASLVERFPNMKLSSTSVVWNNNLAIRSLKNLPILLN